MKFFLPLLLATALSLNLSDVKAQGGSFSLNSTVNGTISSATADIWDITTTSDGFLQFTLTGAASSDLVATLYDNDGTTMIGASAESFNGSVATINADGLAPGTYHVKVAPFSTVSGFGTYSLTNVFSSAVLANDAEPNDNAATAVTLSQNGSSTGHVGYYYNGLRDGSDWYKITTNADGILQVTLATSTGSNTTLNPLDVNVWLYDNDATTQLKFIEVFNGNGSATNSITVDGLAAGTYYVKVAPFATEEFANYSISSNLNATTSSDPEPNGSAGSAVTLPLNGSAAGHVGYYYNNKRDTTDWYKVTTTGNGLLQVTLASSTGSNVSLDPLDVNVWLYDNDGTTQLGFVEVFNGNGPATGTFSLDGLAPGTYYIKVQNFATSEFANYTLSNNFSPAPVSNDAEPNGSPANAIILPLNSGKTGQVGYYYNNQRDTTDWYKVTTNANGLLQVTLATSTGSNKTLDPLDVNVWLYDNDGTTQLGTKEIFNGYDPATGTFNVDGLSAGTYYIKVQNFATAEFSNYTLSNNFIPAALAEDAEPNGSLANAMNLSPNSSSTGQVGYYYNHQRDSADWYKLITTASGPIVITLTTARGSNFSNNTLDVNVWLYDNDGTTQLGFVEVFNGNGPGTDIITSASLPSGTYYIKIRSFATDEFANYTISNTANASSPIVVSTNIVNAPCFGQTGSITFELSGGIAPFTYNLTNTAKGIDQTNGTGIFTGLPAGIYLYSIRDINGLNVAGSVTLTEPPQVILPAILVSGSTTVCSGATVTLSDAVAGGIWTSGDPSVANVSTGGVVTFGTTTAATQVTITYTVANNPSCSSSVSITFIINPPISIGNINGKINVCVGNSISLTDNTTGGVWSSNNANVAINPTTGVAKGVTPGSSIVTYAVTNGGCTASTTTTITVNAVPIVSGISGNGNVLKGLFTILTDATAGGKWSSSNTSIATVSMTGIVKGISGGACTIYYVVSNSSGCSDTARKQITVTGLLSANINATEILCNGGTATLTVNPTGGSGSYQYNLNGGKFQTSNTFTVHAGIYIIIVRDNITGLFTIASGIVNQPSPLRLQVSKQSNTTNGLSNGSFTVSAFGGTAPYEYSINNGSIYQPSGTFKNLSAGNYHISVKDDNGCVALNAAKVTITKKGMKGLASGETEGSLKATDETVQDEDASLQASVFPNPSQTYFTLSLNSSLPQKVEIRVFDLLGHILYTTNGLSTDTYRFGQNFGKGSYFVRIVYNNGVKILKIIKQ